MFLQEIDHEVVEGIHHQRTHLDLEIADQPGRALGICDWDLHGKDLVDNKNDINIHGP